MLSMRRVHLLHRWLGIGFGLLVLLWFLSGLVMLFVPYPSLSQAERMAHTQALDLALVQRPASAAWAALGLAGTPEQVRLNMLAGRPAWHFLADGAWHSVWADQGMRIEVDAQLAKASARGYLPGVAINDISRVQRDQWSIPSRLHAHRPLYRISMADSAGTELYVSSRSGEVVLDTDACERGWNWLGAVIHWVYFTPLRADFPQAWRQVIMWLSFPGIVLALFGLWLGVDRLRLRRRYRGARITPYRGWAKWHHVSGLLAGVFCVTWLFSGWLSVTPFGWLSSRHLANEEAQHWAGTRVSLAQRQLPTALVTTAKVGELEWLAFAGRVYLLGHGVAQDRLYDVHSGQPLPPFSASQLARQAALLQTGQQVAEITALAHGDRYLYGKQLQGLGPLLRVTLADADHTSYYVQPATSRIVASEDDHSRLYRWLFNALHCLDFAPLDQRELARWALVIVLSLGGLTLTSAGLVLGWRRLRR